jgi:hypothetical protein
MISLLIFINRHLTRYIEKHSKFMCDKCINGDFLRLPGKSAYRCSSVNTWKPGKGCKNFMENREPVCGGFTPLREAGTPVE